MEETKKSRPFSRNTPPEVGSLDIKKATAVEKNCHNDSGYFTPSPMLLRVHEGKETAEATPVTIQRHARARPRFTSDTRRLAATQNRKTSSARLHQNDDDDCAVQDKKQQHRDPIGLFTRVDVDRQRAGMSVGLTPIRTSAADRIVTPHPIGHYIGRAHVDFIKEFHHLGLHHIMTCLISVLSASELHSACQVSQTWRQMCLADLDALAKWKAFQDYASAQKENDVIAKLKAPADKQRKVTRMLQEVVQNKLADGDMSSTETEAVKASQTTSLFMRFTNEAKQIGPNEMLDKCPRCSFPARVDKQLKRAVCSTRGCYFNYCVRCRCEFQVNHKCEPISPKVGCIVNVRRYSSKVAKKNLLRLLS